MAGPCGAVTRSGAACRAVAMANGRCQMHGGRVADVKSAAAASAGIYAQALLPEERDLWWQIEVGSLDDEVRLAKIRLLRLLKLADSAELAGLVSGVLKVSGKAEDGLGDFDRQEFRVASPDFGELILRALEMIRKLELARLRLRPEADAAGGLDEEMPVLRPDEALPAKPVT